MCCCIEGTIKSIYIEEVYDVRILKCILKLRLCYFTSNISKVSNLRRNYFKHKISYTLTIKLGYLLLKGAERPSGRLWDPKPHGFEPW